MSDQTEPTPISETADSDSQASDWQRSGAGTGPGTRKPSILDKERRLPLDDPLYQQGPVIILGAASRMFNGLAQRAHKAAEKNATPEAEGEQSPGEANGEP
jgi:hypothetical protein